MILVFYFDDNTIESIINTVITPEQKEIESLTFGIRIKMRSCENLL